MVRIFIITGDYLSNADHKGDPFLAACSFVDLKEEDYFLGSTGATPALCIKEAPEALQIKEMWIQETTVVWILGVSLPLWFSRSFSSSAQCT